MADCILKTSAEVKKSSQVKGDVFEFILNSISHVQDRLVDAGYDFNAISKDPKDLYDLILHTIAKPGATVDGILYEFTHTRPSIFTTFHDYLQRIQYLRERLQQLITSLTDEVCEWIVLAGLKEHKVYNYLMERMKEEMQDWDMFMQEMAIAAYRSIYGLEPPMD